MVEDELTVDENKMVENTLTLNGVIYRLETTAKNLDDAGFGEAAERLRKDAERLRKDAKNNQNAYEKPALKVIINLCDELDGIAHGKMPEAYTSGYADRFAGIGISTENIPKKYQDMGVRLVDVINRLYQICGIVSNNKGKEEGGLYKKIDYYNKLNNNDKEKMDDLAYALFILCYATSGAGPIGRPSVSNSEIVQAIKEVNKAIAAYFGASNEYSNLFAQLRIYGKEDNVLEMALNPNNLSPRLGVVRR